MRKDKEYIFQLRKDGKSYREIQQETGVSRGTLCTWFKNEQWSDHMTARNVTKNHSSEQAQVMRNARIRKLTDLYTQKEQEARVEYQMFKKEPLFWAGLMAYAGEGDKRSKHLVRITNSEFYIHKTFILFALKYLGIPLKSIRGGLIIYPDHNENLCREMWVNMLRIPREQFHKTQVIQGKENLRRLQYGVGMSIISSTALKKKMLVWLSLAHDERFQ